MLITVLLFLLVFTFLAFVHEVGHLVWAKRAGIRVPEFGIGFGPRIFSFTWNKTLYCLNLIPILGYVKIAGSENDEADKDIPAAELFSNKTPTQKLKCLAAGALMNISIAAILLAFSFIFFGVPTGISNQVGSISPGSPAEQAGLKINDIIVSIDGLSFPSMDEAITFIHNNPDKELTLSVRRLDQEIQLKATPKLNKRLKVGLLGFSPKPISSRINPLLAIYKAIEQTLSMILLTLVILWRLITGGVSVTDLAGPVGIAQITGKYAQSGVVSLIYFTAFLNVNIGVLNLLPLPALDGGHIVFVLLEWLRKKPFNPKLVSAINNWGFIALLALMAFVTYNDILRLFGCR